MSHSQWRRPLYHGQVLPVLLSEKSNIFAATTMPGETQPLPVVDITKIKTQPLPMVLGKKTWEEVTKPRYPKQMFWWSLGFIVAGYVALFWAQSVINLVVCEWIGLACICLWLIDLLIFSLFFRD